MEYIVNFSYDNEANVWISTSDDIPGLILESDTFDELRSRIPDAAAELLAFSGIRSAFFVTNHCFKLLRKGGLVSINDEKSKLVSSKTPIISLW